MGTQEKITDTAQDMRRTMLLSAVREEMENFGMNPSRLAREAGLSGVRVSQWLQGLYRGSDLPVMEKALESWLSAVREGREMAARGYIPTIPAWLSTPTANKILLALKLRTSWRILPLFTAARGLARQ